MLSEKEVKSAVRGDLKAKSFTPAYLADIAERITASKNAVKSFDVSKNIPFKIDGKMVEDCDVFEYGNNIFKCVIVKERLKHLDPRNEKLARIHMLIDDKTEVEKKGNGDYGYRKVKFVGFPSNTVGKKIYINDEERVAENTPITRQERQNYQSLVSLCNALNSYYKAKTIEEIDLLTASFGVTRENSRTPMKKARIPRKCDKTFEQPL